MQPVCHKHDVRVSQPQEFGFESQNKHSAITSVFVRAAHGRTYVGINFKADKTADLQERLKKHGIRTGKNVAKTHQYDTKNAERQLKLIEIAQRDGAINDLQVKALLGAIARK